jgi:hypothetical protein
MTVLRALTAVAVLLVIAALITGTSGPSTARGRRAVTCGDRCANIAR